MTFNIISVSYSYLFTCEYTQKKSDVSQNYYLFINLQNLELQNYIFLGLPLRASCLCQRSLNRDETLKKNRSESEMDLSGFSLLTAKLLTIYQVCAWIKKINHHQPIIWSRETGPLLFSLNTSRPKFFIFIKLVQSRMFYPLRWIGPGCCDLELLTITWVVWISLFVGRCLTLPSWEPLRLNWLRGKWFSGQGCGLMDTDNDIRLLNDVNA